MKTTHILTVVALLLAGVAAWLWRHGDFADTPTAKTAMPVPIATSKIDSGASAGQAPDMDDESKARLLLALADEVGKATAVRWSAQRVADNYRRAATAEGRHRALAELRDSRFKRDDAARVLRDALRDTDVGVRVFAANLLYEMGLADGKETLLEILRSARSLTPHELTEVVTAAQILDRHREIIPADLLIELYEETEYGGIVRLMALQGDERYLPYLIASARKEPNSSVHSFGLLGVSEGHVMASQVFKNTRSAEVRVAAAWAMFRCGGDLDALAYVLDQAAARLGQGVKEGYDPDASGAAIRLISITRNESVLPLLHQAVMVNSSSTSGTALASLFYVQNDAAFVDQFVRNYLSDPAVRESSAVDPNLVWQIAASRNDQSLSALAYAANPDRTRRLIIEGKDRPVVEVWIRQYLSDIPRR